MSEQQNEIIRETENSETPFFVTYYYTLFEEYIMQNKNTGLYYLDPLYAYFIREAKVTPEELGLSVTFEEVKEALRLEVERRNCGVNTLFSTIADIKKGIENFAPSAEDANIDEMIKLAETAKTLAKEDEASALNEKIPDYGQMNFSKKK